MPADVTVTDAIERLYRSDARKVFATLVRLLGDFTLAEEALHEAFLAAAERWPTTGIPASPVPWRVSAGRFKVIDGLRRQRRMVGWEEAGDATESAADAGARWDDEREPIEDNRLRLIFTCCHPSLAEGPHRADAARGVRPRDRADRACLPAAGGHARAAHRAREGEDPRRPHPL